jgi:16S rRNA (cytosine1402-N4)-methyltransferase
MASSIHIPVLLHETIDGLALQPGNVVVDGTTGGGGHSSEICKVLRGDVTLVCFDLDETALSCAREKIEATGYRSAHYIQGNFRSIRQKLSEIGITKIDRAVFDLGLRSDQLEGSGRGFSFNVDEPLQMTFASTPGDGVMTARDIVNQWDEEALANAIYGYGEERYSRRIAHGIVTARTVSPIGTSGQLADIVSSSVPVAYRRGRIHPATKTFQALRMAVNDELGALSEVLTSTWDLLNGGGRIAVISFHSLEDRIVKRYFKHIENEEKALVVTKRPIVATEDEIANNPRSRSAKLRIVEKKIPDVSKEI